MIQGISLWLWKKCLNNDPYYRRNGLWDPKLYWQETTSFKCTCRPTRKVSAASLDLCRGLCHSENWLSYMSSLVASWKHLHYCRCIQEDLRILLQHLRSMCLTSEGSGRDRNPLDVPARSTGVPGRFACGFWTILHFADVCTVGFQPKHEWSSNRVPLRCTMKPLDIPHTDIDSPFCTPTFKYNW